MKLVALAATLLSLTSCSAWRSLTSPAAAPKPVDLPLPVGTMFVVSQGPFGQDSHNEPGNEYSWDFDVPFGTPVIAVEGGKVIQVWSPNQGGGCDPKFSALAHNIKIEHADGTVAQYVHVDSRVELGQTVARGDVIAVTGDNGWLCQPQLHFGVYASREQLYASPHLVGDGLRGKTIPLAFNGLPGGAAQTGLRQSVPRLPGDDAHPEIFHDYLIHPSDATKRIEIYWMKPAGAGPWPAVIDIHGHQEPERPGAAVGFPWYVKESKAGYVAIGVSQPGYGRSDGKPDYCGPFTQEAVRAVLTHFQKQAFVKPDAIALYGVSRGAVVAAMVAAREPKLAALVLDVGIYDMKEAYRALRANFDTASIAQNIAAEAGTTDEAFRLRSPLARAREISAPTLIMTAEHDHAVSRRQARRLAKALEKRGVPVKFVDFPGHGHFIPHKIRNAEIDPFLAKYLGK